MPFDEWIAPAKDAVVGIAALITAFVAVLGVQSWRRELRGRAEFDIARSLLMSTYKVREALRASRSPMIIGSEFPQPYQERYFDKKTEREEAEAYAHVYMNRLRPVFEALQEFDARRLEAEVLWGQDVRTVTDRVRQCVFELQAAVEAVVDDKMSGGTDFKNDREFAKKVRGEISWSPSESANEFSREIASSIAGVESIVRPHMKQGRRDRKRSLLLTTLGAASALAVLVVFLLITITRIENERYALSLGMCKSNDNLTTDYACLEKTRTRTGWWWHVYYALFPTR